MKRVGSAICRFWWWLVGAGPVVLAGLSAYYLFFIVVPFFLLGVYKVPLRVLDGDTVSYEAAMGVPATIPALFVCVTDLGTITASCAWLLSFVNFCRTRSRYVLTLLLLAALPIAYVNAGPYAQHIGAWIWGD